MARTWTGEESIGSDHAMVRTCATLPADASPLRSKGCSLDYHPTEGNDIQGQGSGSMGSPTVHNRDGDRHGGRPHPRCVESYEILTCNVLHVTTS